MLADTQIVTHPHVYKHGLDEEQGGAGFATEMRKAR
jgi:hypothetical protein